MISVMALLSGRETTSGVLFIVSRPQDDFGDGTPQRARNDKRGSVDRFAPAGSFPPWQPAIVFFDKTPALLFEPRLGRIIPNILHDSFHVFLRVQINLPAVSTPDRMIHWPPTCLN